MSQRPGMVSSVGTKMGAGTSGRLHRDPRPSNHRQCHRSSTSGAPRGRYRCLPRWLQCVGERVDFDSDGKMLTAATNEHERVDHPGRRANITRPRQAPSIEREAPNEKLPKFRVMADAIFREYECCSFAIVARSFDDFDLGHGLLSSIRSRKSLIFSAISALNPPGGNDGR